MIRLRKTSAALAVLVAFAAVQLPSAAEARRQVSVTITPHGRNAELVREGLQLYSVFERTRNRARVDQKGSGNGAAIGQSGQGNVAEVFQRGRGHSATISQTGNHNAFGIFQFGRNTSSTARQTGNDNVGLVLQGGW